MTGFLEAHSRLEPAAAGGRESYRPGDRATLTATVVHAPGGDVRFPSKDELQDALGPSVRVLSEPRLAPPVPADPPGRPPGSGVSVSGSWQLQLLLPPNRAGERHELVPREGAAPVQLVSESGETLDAWDVPGVELAVETSLDAELAARLDEASGRPDELRSQVFEHLAGPRAPRSFGEGLTLAQGLALGGGLALALLALLLARRLNRRSARPAPVGPPEPAHVVARRRLSELPALLDRGEHLAFHVELADVLKGYLGRRLGLDLKERTTHGIGGELRPRGRPARLPVRVHDDVVSVLRACDLVKFARDVPARSESVGLIEQVESVIDRTMPEPPSESDAEARREGAA